MSRMETIRKSAPQNEVYDDVLTNGIIGPSRKMLGPVADGGKITFITSPGCWGPIITPTIRGGHAVCAPVAVENADVGDAVAIKVEDIKILSKAASSGVDRPREGYFIGDASVAKKCPSCRELWPEFVVEGIGQEAIRCKNCGTPVSPFTMINGYTMMFSHEAGLGITVDRKKSESIARDAWAWHSLPKNSTQVPILIFGQADIVGLASRISPMLGQLGTTPAVNVPDSHNAKDVGYSLINAPHPYSLKKEEWETKLTDGHMDIDAVKTGALVIAPVLVKGGGVYAGDAHAMIGDGEAAGHTTDVSSESTVSVSVMKHLKLDGPLLIPLENDLPPLAKPWRKDEWEGVRKLAKEAGIEAEPVAPIQVVGSGPTVNEAATDGFQRAGKLFDMSVEEVRNRATISGAVEIGRLPGIVQVSMQVPLRILEELGLDRLVTTQYGLHF
jgi:acetamidase/formamidase